MPLTFKESQEAMEMVFKFLDSIDILPYIEEFKGQKLSDMMDKLEEDYPYKDKYSSCLFDAITNDEFAKYLNKRYNLKIEEVTITYYRI